jgi:TP901 family phage tail tape measure protein
MRIVVSVASNQAAARLAQLRGGVAALGTQVTAANRMTPLGSTHLRSLNTFGQRLQWTGRMLMYNFTLPIIAAGVAATKWAMDNEKAMTHVAKVYGDTRQAAAQFRKESKGLMSQAQAETKARRIQRQELNALGEAFTAISNHYGVQKKEVLEVAGAWAAAGVSGRALADSVNLTMKAVIIGDMEAAKATTSLIAIQGQFNLSTKELNKTLSIMNSVENATAVSMADLIDGFARAAGMARQAGVDVRELSAMMAALVPATGSAASAGNALKTLFSRLVAPTKEAAQVMKEMGLNTAAASWQNLTATERLKVMAREFNNLHKSQQNVAASVIASRWQVNRFAVLMKAIVNPTSMYAQALKASEDQGYNFVRMQKELNTVLESDPRRMQRMWVMIQNGMSKAIIPLIPHILYLVDSLARLTGAFADLSPETQKWIMWSLLALAAIGPLVRYIGALHFLFDLLKVSIINAAIPLMILGKFLMTPFTAAFKYALLIMSGAPNIVMTVFVGISKVLMLGFNLIVAYTARGLAALMAITAAGWARISGIWLLESAFTTSIYTAAWSTIRGLAVTGWAWLQAKYIVMQAVVITRWAVWNAMMATLSALSWSRIRGIVAAGLRGMLALIIASGPLMMKAVVATARFMVGPWGLAIMAIVGLLVAFKSQIVAFWNNLTNSFKSAGGGISGIFTGMANGILRAFNALPSGIQRVLVAIVTMVHDAAMAIYNWFSYINPWASHSPSLVENFTTGMDRIVKEASKLSKIKQYTTAAYNEIKRFGNLTAGLNINANVQQQKEDRKDIRKAGGGAAAIKSYNHLQAISSKLQGVLSNLETKIARQEKVVDRWQKKVDQANKYLEEQQAVLDKLGEKVDKWQGKLDEAQNRLQDFASVPIKGMAEMEDAIFANDQATKRLRLSMMDMEDVYGTFDDIKSKIDAINGAQELISGQKNELRAAGAGSEILGQFDKELAALDKNRDAYQEQADKLANVQKEIDALGRAAERLDLVKSLNFDGLQREIEKAVNGVKEMSFEDIMAGIKDAQTDVAVYTEKLNEANAAYSAQQDVVKQATEARDALQERLDQEQATLDALRDKYDRVNEAIQAINDTISQVVASAQKMNEVLDKAAEVKKKKGGAGSADYVSPGLQAFRDAGKGDFPDVGGSGMPTRKDWSSQVDQINKFTDDLSQSTADLFAQINPFKPLMEKAKHAWEWIKDKAHDIFSNMGNPFKGLFEGIDDNGRLKSFGKKLEDIGEFLTGFIKGVGKVVKFLVEFLGPEFKHFFQSAWEGVKGFWETVGPKLGEFVTALGQFWDATKPLWILIGGAIAFFVKGVLGGAAEAIGPLIDTIGDVLGGLIDVLTGVFQVIAGIFTLNGDLIWDGIKNIFGGAFDAIYGIIKAPIELAWNFISGFFTSIIDGAQWLYDKLVGHSIIPDMVGAIAAAFKPLVQLARWIWDKILKPVFDAFVDLWNWVKPKLAAWWEGVKAEFKFLWGLAVWVWDHILKPVFDKVVALWEWVKPKLAAWWEGITAEFKILWGLAVWVWDNILKPVFDKVKDLWTEHVKPELSEWWERIKNVWDKLKDTGTWIKTNVMDPVFSAFKTGWNDIKKWFEDNADILTKPVGKVVNGVISGVNFLIRGLNKISDVLPGIDFHITEIPGLARGGQIPTKQVGNGFITNGARAIVGEGKQNHPEYVIPTDPTHRKRARFLLHDAAKRLGETTAGVIQPGGEFSDAKRILAGQPTVRNMDGVPMYGLGGIIGDVSGWVKDKVGSTVGGAADWIVNQGHNMASFIMDPFFDGARGAMNNVGWVVPREVGKYSIDQVEAWVDGVDNAFNDIVKNSLGGKGIQDALAFAKSQVGKPYQWGGVGPDGYDCSGFMSALTNVIRGKSPYSRVGSTGTFPWAGFTSGVAPIQGAFTIGSSPSYSGGIGHMAGTLAGVNVESSGGIGVHIGPGARGYNDSGFSEHAYLAMKAGGVALRRSGGTPIIVGDGRYDDWRAANPKSGNNLHFYGDLSFPNITSGDDAEQLIENLNNLAKD